MNVQENSLPGLHYWGPYYKGVYYLGIYIGAPIFVNPYIEDARLVLHADIQLCARPRKDLNWVLKLQVSCTALFCARFEAALVLQGSFGPPDTLSPKSSNPWQLHVSKSDQRVAPTAYQLLVHSRCKGLPGLIGFFG